MVGRTVIQGEVSVHGDRALSTVPHGHPSDPSPNRDPTCWPAGCHSAWWSHPGSRTAGDCCLWGHRGGWRLSGAGAAGAAPEQAAPSPRPPHSGSSPSVLLPSVKSWLCMIFSTMSSASIRVSSTQVGWLSTESFFRLGGAGQSRVTAVRPVTGARTTVVSTYGTQVAPSARENLVPVVLL